jgi:hypothetical protein
MAKYNKKILLPQLEITQLADVLGRETSLVIIPTPNDENVVYHTKPKYIGISGRNRSGMARQVKQQYNCFPVVLDSNGVPWAEAVVYILSRLEGVTAPNMPTYAGIADDLASYRRFLDENCIDWIYFPAQKFARPTYRFSSHLKFAVYAAEIAATSARRQMGTVIGFYRWLKEEGVLTPQYPPWKESDRYIEFKDSYGRDLQKKVITTDISIKVPTQNDPYGGYIDDGGKLRPLTLEEQEWLVDALISMGNTEMSLIHLLGLLTGARIQSILTFRVRHITKDVKGDLNGEIRLPIGPGTGIDTKNNKKMTLHIPLWLYQTLQTYADSDRAKKRRIRAGGDYENQYLFLSVRGAPLYQSKEELQTYNETNKLRHVKIGQGVRQYITERIVPFIREKYGVPGFRYQFHDTRATAGMNWTDHQLKLVEQGKATLHEAREFVKIRMGHDSSATTDRYLQYRQNLKIVRWGGHEYESHLKRLSDQVMAGVL